MLALPVRHSKAQGSKFRPKLRCVVVVVVVVVLVVVVVMNLDEVRRQ